MARRLRARSIKVIVYDEKIPLNYYTLDFIHWTREGHAMIAAALVPHVLAMLEASAVMGRPAAMPISTEKAMVTWSSPRFR